MRSASERSMQNSLPSGSARTTQPLPSSVRWSATRWAPMPMSRSTSSLRVVSGPRSRWTRFLSCFDSGTLMKSRLTCPEGSTRRLSSSSGPFGYSGSSAKPVTCSQNFESAWESRASKVICRIRETMRIR
ncbi:hypothetical protein FAB82_14575 [Glycomyces buryatensis]|uniref:Uncharacterized protein n=1 Tax=Glycomyces buryatensis TaxID=2570927 RepID=A0A4S8QIE4_9ACTN|nr:hypothetical protein FAB82_14575 [Glycomyces buryatensis]